MIDLQSIRGPRDIVALSMEERIELAEAVRELIIRTVCRTGGHLAPSLGVVELTIALLSIFDPPDDRVVWDVGHQTYPYKILTGRAAEFETIRQRGGLSGFPRRDESPFDAFGTGHSSTGISAALGFALARDRAGGSNRIVAVVGDGAMTGGMALEALNHLGHTGTDMIVVLNDNRMSISRNVGGLSRYLTRLITDPTYNRLRNDLWNMLGRVPLGDRMRHAAHVLGEGLKSLIAPTTIFDDFGIRYVGPVPGHDLPALTAVLERVTDLRGPVLVHVVTVKGKGYEPAEENASKFHGISGSIREEQPEPAPGFTSVFSDSMVSLGEKDDRIVAVTAAMPDGTGLSEFASRFPQRFF
ncbi:1-deoxy-D-xylulose-5-phosphate synthase, partial [Candidatus Fermentibacterales bacterium]|nr:1-deoxy-D-xylulose-5-phosphate synthase [Candidatus Fermentibacterales bacterium]